jgi:hypothetical protein
MPADLTADLAGGQVPWYGRVRRPFLLAGRDDALVAKMIAELLANRRQHDPA